MAETIGVTSGLLALATSAFQSCGTLYETIQTFQFHPKRVCELKEELQALRGVLGSLTEAVSATTDVELSSLDLPLLRCGNSCNGFEQEIMECSSRSGDSQTSFRDWAKLRYMGDDIDGFRQQLAGYKSTINMALTDANLRKSSVTAVDLSIPHPKPTHPGQESGRTLQTLKGGITYSEAADQEHNVLQQLTYWQKREEFIDYLFQHTREIENIVSCYLRLKGTERCRLSPREDWIHGSFNICLPVYIDNWRKRPGGRVIIRFPLPFKVGDSNYPGNADEKVRCEAATYVWIRENCSDVPIPYLWGFAFAGGAEGPEGSSFVTLENAPLLVRVFEILRRRVHSLLNRAIPCQYISSGRPYNLKIGHLVIDYIEETDGRMLSTSWEEQRHDKCRRTNLFRGLSRIMLTLGKVPLPRIGSFTMDNEGVISLTNRPLRFQLHQLENEGIPTAIGRGTTYVTTESYLFDVLACHDSHLVHQLNAVNDEDDCRSQMAALATMGAVLPRFIRQDLRRGPFILTLTDLHQSNIFVDDEWNIKYLIDLEWACSLPIEMQHPPYWLTSQTVDGLVDEQLTLFDKIYKEFLDIFAHEALLLPDAQEQQASLLRARTMKRGWEDGSFFYFLALDSISGLYGLFIQHIQERFDYHVKYDAFRRMVSPYWRPESEKFIAAKIKQKSEYDRRLLEMFEKQASD